MATGLFNLKQVNQAISQGAWSGYIAPKWVEYLVVAGGGGAGYTGAGSGGGGAGGLLTGIATVATGTSYTVTVGAGGSGSTSSGNAGGSGAASLFGSISATGGGGGASGGGPNATVATAGGSGGGATSSGYNTQYETPKAAQGISGQGNGGGKAAVGTGTVGTGNFGGGGGGAGTVGIAGVNNATGNGGAGIASSISGSVVAYAGGGAGGTNNASGGLGGVGGGGSTGLTSDSAGVSGGGNTGGGGGGGWANSVNQNGGAGGSGIVVVRYPGSIQFFTGGTLSYANGYMIHTFYASGTLAPTTPTPYVTDYQISRSLRFNSADSAYLSRTPASAGNRRTWTWSAWIKRSALGVTQQIFSSRPTASPYALIYFASETLNYAETGLTLTTTQVFRDVSAWYHIVIATDTTQATASDRLKFYVNGVQVTSFSTATYPSQNYDTQINTATQHNLSGAQPYGAEYFSGYMTEVNFIDGQALTPSSFGYTNPATGVWSPLAFVGTYGTNGFELNFSDNSNTTAATLGKDYSGNGNNWTPNNFSVTAGAGNDSLVDSPTSYGVDTGVGGTVRGNYCTLNPLSPPASGSPSYANGNLDGGVASYQSLVSTFSMTSGQWYWEVTPTGNSGSAGYFVAVSDANYPMSTRTWQGANFWGYYQTGSKYTNGGSASYGASFTTNDVIGVALDMDAGTVTFYKNGVSQGVAYSSLTGKSMQATVGDGTSTSIQYFSCNFGQRPFAYTAPSGFKALCTQNLPTPTIGATTATQAGKFFNPVLYTGTGATNSITGVGFQPDWVWVKSRSAATDHGLYDAVRGVQKQLESNNTDTETTETTGLTAFNSDGFTTGALAQLNTSSATYVAWNWKANGSGSTNTAGSITSTVSANTTSGFSVVTWTGNGADASIGHGLGVAPSMVIHKFRSAVSNWSVYTSTTGAGKRLKLNSTDAVATDGSFPTTPTSTVFYINGGSNDNGVTMVAYCFAPISGFSAFGSYAGNGSTDGTFVYFGFRPAYVMIKASSAVDNWVIMDAARNPANAVNYWLQAESSAAEATLTPPQFDFVSNGLKLRGTSSSCNASGVTYIYMAFASSPFKFSLGR